MPLGHHRFRRVSVTYLDAGLCRKKWAVGCPANKKSITEISFLDEEAETISAGELFS
jgi:hypothetical protein